MSLLQSIQEAVRTGRPVSPPVDLALRALTPLTRVAMAVRLKKKRTRVDARVISFGNLTAGGTGKTPAVIERAAAEMDRGRKVAVLTRGYHGSLQGGPHTYAAPPRLKPEERRRLAEGYGDEPALIAMRVPGVTIVKCPDRVAGAKAAIAAGCDTLILDDGYQYVRLDRDENVLVIDASNPFGNGQLLPRGIMREPLGAMVRATHVILTRCDQAGESTELNAALARYLPAAEIRRTEHAPLGLWRLDAGEELGLDWLAGRRVAAACGIGHPEAFEHTLETLGALVEERQFAANHGLKTLNPGELPVITTEKDAVRLDGTGRDVAVLRVGLREI